MSDDELAGLQSSTSDWHARRARVILQHRASQGALSASSISILKKLFGDVKNPDYRMRAMWAMHITSNLSQGELLTALSDKDEYVRAWAIQMSCEDMSAPKSAVDRMVTMSRQDPSPVVRLYLAASLQRVNAGERWRISEGLISKAKDIDDHNIPKMIWYGMEDLVRQNPGRAITLAASGKIPLIAEFTSRRLVDANALDRLVAEVGKQPLQVEAMMKGLLAGLEGRSDAKPPANWAAVYNKLKVNKTVGPIALQVAQLFGDSEAAQEFLKTLKNTTSSMEVKRNAIKNLASRQRDELASLLPVLVAEPQLRIEAIRAVASYDRESLGRLLLEKFDDLNVQEQGEALQTLSSRSSYGRLLTEAIKDGSIKKASIPAYVARQLRRVVGNGFVEVWGPIDQLAGDKSVLYTRYRNLLKDQSLTSADLTNGKMLFVRTCSPCHRLYGEGGQVGPDITGSNRTNIEYLLSNLIEPSGEIQDDYRMVVITSRDGRTYSGNVIAENDRQVTLRVIGQDQLVLNKSDIQSRETAAVSMMPEGLLQTLSDKEVVDLVAYLRTSQQVQ
jgi:putative heme-binding domain-containing protein